jgi:hypothetical protein
MHHWGAPPRYAAKIWMWVRMAKLMDCCASIVHVNIDVVGVMLLVEIDLRVPQILHLALITVVALIAVITVVALIVVTTVVALIVVTTVALIAVISGILICRIGSDGGGGRRLDLLQTSSLPQLHLFLGSKLASELLQFNLSPQVKIFLRIF